MSVKMQPSERQRLIRC